MYRRETFGQYLGAQVKEALKFIGLVWMMVGAPSGTIILGIFVWGATQKEGTMAGASTATATYLWCGFSFCLLCTLITICFALYNDYQNKVKSRETWK